MTEPVDVLSRLRRVITLLLVNLALSAVLAALFIASRQSPVDYQLARMDLPSGADLAGIRDGLSAGPWSRAVVVVIVAVVHTFLIRRLRLGLLWAATRPAVRALFARPAVSAA